MFIFWGKVHLLCCIQLLQSLLYELHLISSVIDDEMFPGEDSGGEEAVGASYQTHHSGKPPRHHPTDGEKACH